jgi:hypothetical protein
VTEEVLHQYKKYQRSLVNHHTRLQFEYSSLIEQEEYREDDIEIHVGRKSEVSKAKSHDEVLNLATVNMTRQSPLQLIQETPGTPHCCSV